MRLQCFCFRRGVQSLTWFVQWLDAHVRVNLNPFGPTLGVAHGWAGGRGRRGGNIAWRRHRRRHRLLVPTPVAATAPPDRQATPLSVIYRRFLSARAYRGLRGCCARARACRVRTGSGRASVTSRRRSGRRGGGGVRTAAGGRSWEAICRRGRATGGFCQGSHRRRGGHGVAGAGVRWRSVEPERDSPRPDSRKDSSAPGWSGAVNVGLTVMGPPRRRRRPYRAHCCAHCRADGASNDGQADGTSRCPHCRQQAWTHPTAPPVLFDMADTHAPAVGAVMRSVRQGTARARGGCMDISCGNDPSLQRDLSALVVLVREGGVDRQTGGLSLTAYDAGKVPPAARIVCVCMLRVRLCVPVTCFFW